MQQNQFEQPETPYVSASALETVSTSSSLPDPVEAYLEELLNPMKQSLPVKQVEELRKEWRGHLEDMVAANIELGSSPEEALEQVQRQFGRSRMISRRYQQAWEQLHGQESMKCSRQVALFFLASVILLYETGSRLALGDGNLALFLFLELPFIMGFLTGQFTEDKESRAWLQATVLLFPVLLCVYKVWAGMQVVDLSWDGPSDGLFSLTAQFTGITIFGTLGTWAGGRVRNVAKRRRSHLAR